jgi:ferredoxin
MIKIKSDPKLLADVRKYGKFDTNACLQCGSCTVICDLTKDTASFPRRSIQNVLFGLKEMVLSSLEPWLCYYCGDCSTTCPRQTEPGEAMMTLRRYLTAQYDWTGITAKLYQSNLWHIVALLTSGVFMTFLIALFHGPLITERVELNTFAPAELVHMFDISVALLVAVILFSNVFRMYWFTMHRGEKIRIPFSLYLTEAVTLILHFVTQKQFLSCSNKNRWIKHFLLVTGYILMFSLVVVFLEWFQTDNIYPFYHPQRWLGYYAAAVLIYFTGEIIISRIRKREEIHKFSDFSDWMFPILLLLMAVTGIAVHIFRYLELPLATYYSYVIHLIVAFSWLVVIIPFGKWTHLFYRSFAIYFQTIKEKALHIQLTKEAILDHAT